MSPNAVFIADCASKVIDIIIEKYEITEDDAIKRFITSKLYSDLTELDMWMFSPLALYYIFVEEYENGRLVYPM